MITIKKILLIKIIFFILTFLSIPYVWSGCISGDCINGYGTYTFEDGKYVGEFKNSKLNGYGTLTFTNKLDPKKYVGEFKNNKLHGYGTLTYDDNHPNKRIAGLHKKGTFRKGFFKGNDNPWPFFFKFIFFFLIAGCFYMLCQTFGLTVIGNAIIVIGIFCFSYDMYKSIKFSGMSFTQWIIIESPCIIIKLTWAVAGGFLLRILDIPVPPLLEVDKNTEICDKCHGKGKIKTGDRTIYDYETKSIKKICECVDDFSENYADAGKTFICSRCRGKREYETTIRVFKGSHIVPVIIDCEKCQKTGYTGEHMKRIIKREEIKFTRNLSLIMPFLYILYILCPYSLFLYHVMLMDL